MGTSYRDLKAWQRGMDLVVQIYQLTESFPRSEMYGLTSQMRRAAVSIPANIAEGRGRSSDRDFIVFLHHSRGSANELETLAEIACRLALLSRRVADDLAAELAEIGRILNGLINALSESPYASA